MPQFLTLIARTVRVLGSPLGFWPGAIVLLFVYGANGRATDALPSIVLWVMVCGVAYALRKLFLRSGFARLDLPEELKLPPAKAAVAIGPQGMAEDVLSLPQMVERLPASLKGLLQRP